VTNQKCVRLTTSPAGLAQKAKANQFLESSSLSLRTALGAAAIPCLYRALEFSDAAWSSKIHGMGRYGTTYTANVRKGSRRGIRRRDRECRFRAYFVEKLRKCGISIFPELRCSRSWWRQHAHQTRCSGHRRKSRDFLGGTAQNFLDAFLCLQNCDRSENSGFSTKSADVARSISAFTPPLVIAGHWRLRAPV
jgi:hypothetical protein